MFSLLDRIDRGADCMLADLESFIIQSGLDDMKACASVITTVRGCHFEVPATITHTHTHTYTYTCIHTHTRTHAHVPMLSIQDSEKYVEELLNLFNRFSKLVREAFRDDPRFLTARDKVQPKHVPWCVWSLVH